VPVPSIAPEQYDAFALQMSMLVFEEAGVWEAPSQSTAVRSDSTEIHGPWPSEACSRILLRWFDAGWLGVYRRHPSDEEPQNLPPDAARAALVAVEDWAPSTALFLFPTVAGDAADLDEWRSLVG
jgi:hypothetical protein